MSKDTRLQARGSLARWSGEGALLAVFLSLTLVCASCTATYAPPVRYFTPGAPGRIKAGDYEVGFSFFSASLTTGLYDWLSTEVGVEYQALSVMGFTGFRLTASASKYLVSDFEFGAGLGLGGSRCGNQEYDDAYASCTWDGLDSLDRFAGGGYFGLGARLGTDELSMYFRGRGELTKATGVPLTVWAGGLMGLHVTLGRLLGIHCGFGYGGYWNEIDSRGSILLEFGFAFRFGGGAEQERKAIRASPPGDGDGSPAASRRAPALATLDSSCEFLAPGPVVVAVRSFEDPGERLSEELRDDLSRALFSRVVDGCKTGAHSRKIRFVRVSDDAGRNCSPETCDIEWGDTQASRMMLRPFFHRDGDTCRIELVLSEFYVPERRCGFQANMPCAFPGMLDGVREATAWLISVMAR